MAEVLAFTGILSIAQQLQITLRLTRRKNRIIRARKIGQSSLWKLVYRRHITRRFDCCDGFPLGLLSNDACKKGLRDIVLLILALVVIADNSNLARGTVHRQTMDSFRIEAEKLEKIVTDLAFDKIANVDGSKVVPHEDNAKLECRPSSGPLRIICFKESGSGVIIITVKTTASLFASFDSISFGRNPHQVNLSSTIAAYDHLKKCIALVAVDQW
jgi:hypothetical protein